MTFADHLWSLMTIPRTDARLTLSSRTVSGADRKSLATALHADVAALFRPVRQSREAALP